MQSASEAVKSYAVKFEIDSNGREPTDENLRAVFATCALPAPARLYPEIRAEIHRRWFATFKEAFRTIRKFCCPLDRARRFAYAVVEGRLELADAESYSTAAHDHAPLRPIPRRARG